MVYKPFEIFEAVHGIDFTGNEDIYINSFFTDSRKPVKNSVFIAVKGEITDGHDYISEAKRSGAAGFIIAIDKYSGLIDYINSLKDDTFFITVCDTKTALLDIASYIKKKISPRLIAVTGSVGKTTTKEFIYNTISQKYKTQKNEGNFNNNIGLPLTIFNLDLDTEYLIQEMGMNNAGEIDRLSRAVNPDIAVITNIGTAHIGNLGSRENIKKAKLEIFNGMNSASTVIMNGDEPLLYAEKNKTDKKEIFYGIENRECDIRALNISSDYRIGETVFDIITRENIFEHVKLSVSGKHNIYNALAAFSAGTVAGLSSDQIRKGLSEFKGQKMRQNIYEINGITIIEDVYNASIESIDASAELLSGIGKAKNKRTVAVISDILETGDFEIYIHEKTAETLMKHNIGLICLTGRASRITYEYIKKNDYINGYEYFDNKTELAHFLSENTDENDIILFKASRGMKLESVIEELKAIKNKKQEI